MFLRLIEPTATLDGPISHVTIPFVPILSDQRSMENVINLIQVINRFDQTMWFRGEIFGSVIFASFSIQLAYIAF